MGDSTAPLYTGNKIVNDMGQHRKVLEEGPCSKAGVISGQLQLPGPQITGNLMSVEDQGAATDFETLVVLEPLQGSAGACDKSSAWQSPQDMPGNDANQTHYICYLQALSSSCTAASTHLRAAHTAGELSAATRTARHDRCHRSVQSAQTLNPNSLAAEPQDCIPSCCRACEQSPCAGRMQTPCRAVLGSHAPLQGETQGSMAAQQTFCPHKRR